MKKRILLINPPIEDFYQTEIRQEPLGLEYIAALLKKNGFIVYILNALAKKSTKNIPLPKQLFYLKIFYPSDDLSPFKLFTQYQHFGMSLEEIRAELKFINPDFIGISVNFTPYFSMPKE